MNTTTDPRSAEIKRPDENNHSSLEDEVLNEEMPVGNPKKRERPESEDFPEKDDEPEPIQSPDQARG